METQECKENNKPNEIRNEICDIKIDSLDSSKTTFNYIYGQEYFEIESKLNSFKESSKSYFNNIASIISDKSQQLINEFHKHFSKISKKIQNSFELKNQATGEEIMDDKIKTLIQKYSKKYLDSFNSVLTMNEQIFENIKQNMDILMSFIDTTSKSLDKKYPTHDFLKKEFSNIINKWMFLKLNFENFDFIQSLNNSEINEKFKNLLFNICESKSFYINLYNNNNISKDIYINNLKISNNQLSILKIKDVNEIENYFKNDLQYKNLKSLFIKNISFEKNQFLRQFPNLEKLNISLCYNFDLRMLSYLSLGNITELYFVNNGFINSDFNRIISDYLIKSDPLRKNLSILSFEDNNLSKIDFNQMVFLPKFTFHSLKELNLKKNKIYKFSINPEYFPCLKVINLCYNNFSISCFNEYKNILVLLSGNVFLMDDVLCANYYTELEKKLNKPLPAFENLCLSYGPKSFSQNYISNVKIGNEILLNLTFLDLSFNHMNCDTFFSFTNNNKRCLNIKRFDLEGNELDDTFFEKYLENNYNELLDNLETLNLNNNLIGGPIDVKYKDDDPIQEQFKDNEKLVNKLRLIYKFIKINKNLKNISIIRNPISKICKIIDASEEEINKNIFKENEKIVINCFYSLLLKIKKELIEDNNGEIGRKKLNIRFDCRSIINQDLDNFNFDRQLIIFKKEEN